MRRAPVAWLACVTCAALFVCVDARAEPKNAPPTSLAGSFTGEAKQSYEQARALFQKGEYQAALDALERTQRLSPDPRLFWNIAACEKKLGRHAKAIGDVERYLSASASLITDDEKREAQQFLIAARAYVGVVTVTVLLTVVLPKLFAMLQEMLTVLPWPTLVLLRVSAFLDHYWLAVLVGIVGAAAGLRTYLITPNGADFADRAKLRLPIMGGLFRAAALGRFARTLGTLVRSGVSLLPALKIVESTIGNRSLSRQIAQVTEETRGGSSLAASLRGLGIFPKSVVQMIAVGEETGKLDDMLLKVASIEERQMRARTKTIISLLAPILIVVVGAVVGFMVIAVLLPIFRMSRGIH